MNDQTLQLQEEVQLGGMLVQGGDDGTAANSLSSNQD